MRWKAIAGIAIVLFMLFLNGGGAHGRATPQTSQWQPPLNLSNSPTVASRYPDIAVDGVGHVHVVWVEEEMENGQQVASAIYYAMNDGRAWTAPVDIVFGQWMLLPNVTVDASGVIHVVYIQGGSLMYTQAAAWDAPWSARNWRKPVALFEYVGEGYGARWPEIQADAGGALHLVYTNLGTVNYRRSDNGGLTWSEPVAIPPDGRGATIEFSTSNRLAINRQGVLFAAWGEEPVAPTSTEPSQLYFSRSTDGGRTWAEPTHIAGSIGTKRLFEPVVLIVDGQDRLHLVWRERDERGVLHLWHRWSGDQGGSWSADQPFCVVSAERYGGMAAELDSLGRVHFVYSAGGLIYHTIMTSEGQCAPPTQISEPIPMGPPYWPKLAIGLGNQVHVVWTSGFPELELRDLDARLQNGDYEIRYSWALLEAPALEPRPFAIEPTPSPTSSPSPTPIPATSTPVVESTLQFSAPMEAGERSSSWAVWVGPLAAFVIVLAVVIAHQVTRPR